MRGLKEVFTLVVCVCTGAEEQFLLRGQVNKKNEILTNFQNFT